MPINLQNHRHSNAKLNSGSGTKKTLHTATSFQKARGNVTVMKTSSGGLRKVGLSSSVHVEESPNQVDVKRGRRRRHSLGSMEAAMPISRESASRSATPTRTTLAERLLGKGSKSKSPGPGSGSHKSNSTGSYSSTKFRRGKSMDMTTTFDRMEQQEGEAGAVTSPSGKKSKRASKRNMRRSSTYNEGMTNTTNTSSGNNDNNLLGKLQHLAQINNNNNSNDDNDKAIRRVSRDKIRRASISGPLQHQLQQLDLDSSMGEGTRGD